ncbi:TPA: preprotein translocase subunit SecA, partial [Candidatus Poribacteria bacterium]|nr:preprotein translocase subunit SecA [Candidatus Poribacteria bacterium]
MGKLVDKIIGSKNDRVLKKLWPIVERVNALEPQIKKLTDDELRKKTDEFKERLKRGETLDDLLPEAFAVVREAAVRTLGQRHYDVQVLGAIVLHTGNIAEMKTGEGKTLAATMPAYLNALTGKGVHIATVNDYLARRDAEWMGPIYELLGLSVGVTYSMPHLPPEEVYRRKKEAYNADITYGVHSEFGFDYLRDNMALSLDQKVQRGHYYAIVDEVDSILIDEARTPLIISGSRAESTDIYKLANAVVLQLREGVDYEVDHKESKRGTVYLTEEGVAKVERILKIDNLFDYKNMDLFHYINQALIAHTLYKKDVDYVVTNGQVIIVDEYTGRLQYGRRFSDGLHQALEAKEHVKIIEETQTLARISYQNYFRMYEKLAGMTGTAATEEKEFIEIYGMHVVVIPTNKPMIRIDYPDVVYKTEDAKFRAVVREIKELYKQGRPVLVGTISIEKSERLSRMLKKERIPHQVLNAKNHAAEAEIIKKAGQPYSVTIATNMAGRGVDIVLGEGVVEMGGLHIIGTERHDSRRIDNQLRGRAGRQGDPGSSRFYVSLEDDLMQKFGSERLKSIMSKVGMDDNSPIEHPWITKAIEKAQKRVEEKHFEARKYLLKFDDVINAQRQVIYEQRDMILKGENLKDEILAMLEEVVEDKLDEFTPKEMNPDEWDVDGLAGWVKSTYGLDILSWEINPRNLSYDELYERLISELKAAYGRREKELGEEEMRRLERLVMLDRLDYHWMEALHNIDYLEEGIGLRGYAGRDPLIEFKKEAFEIFSSMIWKLKEEVTEYMFKAVLTTAEAAPKRRATPNATGGGRSPRSAPTARASGRATSKTKGATSKKGRKRRKIGRNDPCPCGSG